MFQFSFFPPFLQIMGQFIQELKSFIFCMILTTNAKIMEAMNLPQVGVIGVFFFLGHV